MALLLGVSDFGLMAMLQQIAKQPMTDYANEAAAKAAAMPPLLPNQKGVFVTVTENSKTNVYLKTADDVTLLIGS
ncbi:hypothetical protein [Fibrella forsythiae]|uniref:Uncharacterized protein n=1 Tax=Fibrella forsythiae TaxID=2817061 RepID=A0ABS3JB78_9BACT|nr:hypothetical protein [Fibrella forsythiae]MBO0947246.1 hypothetical protein [Fibrella forsythiae]